MDTLNLDRLNKEFQLRKHAWNIIWQNKASDLNRNDVVQKMVELGFVNKDVFENEHNDIWYIVDDLISLINEKNKEK